MRAALSHIGHRQTRNRGTIGGSLVACRSGRRAAGRVRRLRCGDRDREPARHARAAVRRVRRRLHGDRGGAGRDRHGHQASALARRSRPSASTSSPAGTAISRSRAPRCWSRSGGERWCGAPPIALCGVATTPLRLRDAEAMRDRQEARCRRDQARLPPLRAHARTDLRHPRQAPTTAAISPTC